MKRISVKKLVLLVATQLIYSTVLAQGLPTIKTPDELSAGAFAEGTITRLSSAEVAEFLPWAQNARNQLNRALTQVAQLPLRERLPVLERVARAVVAQSGPRQYQLLMRFALNRGLLLVDELERSTDMSAIGAIENALDLVQRSITVALRFYESDLAFQQRAVSDTHAVTIPHAQFGRAFMQELYPAVVNVLDAGAQYRLLYKLVEMVNWDLSRDAEANVFAEIIVEAYELTQDLPAVPSGDDKTNLRYVRRLNSLRIVSLEGFNAQISSTGRGLPLTPTELPSRLTERFSAAQLNSTFRCSGRRLNQSYSASGSGIVEAYSKILARCRDDSQEVVNSCIQGIICGSSRRPNGVVGCQTVAPGGSLVFTGPLQLARESLTAQCQRVVTETVPACLDSITCAPSEIQSSSATNPERIACLTGLYSNGGVSSTQSTTFCEQDSSPEFVTCVSSLYRSAGLSGSGAASFCLQRKDSSFWGCAMQLYSQGGNSGQNAAQTCLKNSSQQLSRCVIHLYNNAGVTGSKASELCLQNNTSEFYLCAENLYKNGGMTSDRAVATCLGR